METIPSISVPRPLTAIAACVLALLLAGCPTTFQRGAHGEVETHFLYFQRGGGEPAKGGMGALWVSAGPNPEYRAPVFFGETTSGGVGDAWRAAAWMALLSASAALNTDPLGMRVLVAADDAVDGPSAGALTTVCIIAAMRGDTLRTDAVMTGTINPDLTVGPVGGIPEKVIAAIELGKTRIGVPMGQRRAVSIRTGRTVDVQALARQRGAEVVVLRDVSDAYELMTGEQLDLGTALPEEAMALPDWVSEVFAAQATKILQAVEDAQREMRDVFDKAPTNEFREARGALLAELRRIRALLEGGSSVSAIYAATGVQGWHFNLTTTLLTRMGVRLGRWEYVGKLLRELRATVAATLEQSMPKWKGYVARTPIEVPYVVDTFEALLHALRGLAASRQLLSQIPALRNVLENPRFVPREQADIRAIEEAMEGFTGLLINAQGNLLLGHAYFLVGQAWLERHRRHGSALDEEALRHVSTQYERVADANLQYMDTLFVRTVAEQRREPPERTRARLMREDSDYRQAVLNRQLPQLMTQGGLTERERIYAVLSGAVSSYFSSATVISKRYSLGAVFDKTDPRLMVGFRHAAAFESMVELADKQARIVAGICQRELGEIPISALIEYQLGRSMERQGREQLPTNRIAGLQQRMEAMTHLWRSYTLGRLALAMQRRLHRNGIP